MTKMLKQFVAIASCDGVMKSKQTIKVLRKVSYHTQYYAHNYCNYTTVYYTILLLSVMIRLVWLCSRIRNRKLCILCL